MTGRKQIVYWCARCGYVDISSGDPPRCSHCRSRRIEKQDGSLFEVLSRHGLIRPGHVKRKDIHDKK